MPLVSAAVRIVLIFSFSFILFFLARIAAAADAPLTTEQIVNRLVASDTERSAKQESFRGTRRYVLDYKGFPADKHAEMVVEVLSDPPRKEFRIVSQSGSKLLLNRVLHKLIESEREANDSGTRRQVKLTPDNYNFELLGTEPVEGRKCYVLRVQPKRNNKFLYKGTVWVDGEDFAPVKISAEPAKRPSFWISSVRIEHHYEKVGDMWLPRSNCSTSKVRFGGNAVLTIDYQQYEFRDASARQGGKRASAEGRR
jgi:hypothetical protein